MDWVIFADILAAAFAHAPMMGWVAWAIFGYVTRKLDL